MKKETVLFAPISDSHLEIQLLEIQGFEDILCKEPTVLLSTDNECESRVGFFIRSLKRGNLSTISSDSLITLYSEHGSSIIKVTFHDNEDFYLDLRLDEKNEKERLVKLSIYALIQNNLPGCPHSETLNAAFVKQLVSMVADSTGHVSHTMRKRHDLFRDLLLFISHSQSESLTMNGISRQYGYTPQYFSLFFKENMGMNFQEFYDAIRVNSSLHDLIQGEESLEDIALKNGFSEYRSYVRAFKKLFQITPNDYRQLGCPFHIAAGLTEDKHLADFLNAICQYESFDFRPDNRAFEKKQIIKTDYGNKGTSIRRPFLNMIRLNEAADLLQFNLKEDLKTTTKDIGFRLIALPKIFSERLPITVSGRRFFSFPLQDKILDRVLEANLRPCIFLSEPTTANGYPYDWEELIRQFMDHLLKRYSYEAVLTWLFAYVPSNGQAWNETSLLHYKQAQNIIKSVSQAILFGSPELYLLDKTMESETKFLQYAEENDCLPDFYDLKYYCGDTEYSHSNSYLTAEPNCFTEYLTTIREIPQLKGKLIFLTSFDFTSQENDYLNDTLYSSTFILKNILENLPYADAFAKSALFDSQKTPLLYTNTFHGGRGLLTCNGIKKANYFAYRFLSRLDTVMLTQGEGYFITKGYNRITIILYHSASFTDAYIKEGPASIVETDRYLAFTEPISNRFIITIHGLGKHTEARIKTSIINRKTGSSYDLFHDNGNVETLTSESLEAIKSLTIPKFTLSEKEIEDGELVIKEDVKSLEAKLLEITLK